MKDVNKKRIIIGYCCAIIISILMVPWKIKMYGYKGASYEVKLGYSLLFAPPNPTAIIDFSLLFLEMILITAIAAIVYLMREDRVDRK